METKRIKIEEEYEAALSRLDEIFDVKPGGNDFEEAEQLENLIELYEAEHYKIEALNS